MLCDFVQNQTDLQLKGCKSKYNGKVREVYHLENNTLVMVASTLFVGTKTRLTCFIAIRIEVTRRIWSNNVSN